MSENEQAERTHKEVLKFIARFHGSEDVFLNGCCYWFAKILEERFGPCSAAIFYAPHEGHFITMIKGRAYDVRGDVTDLYQGKTAYNLNDLCAWDYALYNRLIRDCRNFAEDNRR